MQNLSEDLTARNSNPQVNATKNYTALYEIELFHRWLQLPLSQYVADQ